MDATTGEAEGTRRGPGQHRVRLALIPLLLAMLPSSLGTTIVATSMPTIAGELGGVAYLSWAVTSYTLAAAAAIPVWGRLGDMYGRKRWLVVAMSVFLTGSALCGLAQDMGELIAARTVQGLGGGGLAVGVMAVIGELIPPRERGRYQGMITSVMVFSMIVGPLIGGGITDSVGWRWTFLVNLPVGVLAMVLIARLVRVSSRCKKARIDYVGAVLLVACIVSFVLVVTWGGVEYAWGSGMIVALAAVSVAALAGFVHAQSRAAEPVLPPHLFRSLNFSLMSVLSFTNGFVMFGAVLYLPLYQQAVHGVSATGSGLLLLPMLGALVLVSQLSGRFVARTGRYKVLQVSGGAAMFVGTLLLSRVDTETSRLTAALFMVLLGAGMGFLGQNVMTVAQNSVVIQEVGVASAAMTLFRTLGQSVGVAVMGTLFNGRVRDVMAERADGASLPDTRLDAEGMGRLEAGMRTMYRSAVAEGVQEAFLLASSAAGLALLTALLVREVPLRTARK
ncbi:MDR family MFS transporter [Streptomyces sp. KMM 9044]|uniref:MDR family MFS transporter n=1 Tax=Streptomyces sp. KMM 9044 TaxID=2744474 RepID=UPI00215079AB|nr:MDR family MFS transporter [Streptomyces sp. KMM 9044]WAX76343.1 MDR family MFS transporter [Streptomyces sp. KMM 9044]